MRTDLPHQGETHPRGRLQGQMCLAPLYSRLTWKTENTSQLRNINSSTAASKNASFTEYTETEMLTPWTLAGITYGPNSHTWTLWAWGQKRDRVLCILRTYSWVPLILGAQYRLQLWWRLYAPHSLQDSSAEERLYLCWEFFLDYPRPLDNIFRWTELAPCMLHSGAVGLCIVKSTFPWCLFVHHLENYLMCNLDLLIKRF